MGFVVNELFCPSCLNESLTLWRNGVVDIIINGKRRDTGIFYYDMSKSRSIILENFRKKCEEFFEWYSEFHNVEPIKTVQLLTRSASCKNNCFFKSGTKFSVIDILISARRLKK